MLAVIGCASPTACFSKTFRYFGGKRYFSICIGLYGERAFRRVIIANRDKEYLLPRYDDEWFRRRVQPNVYAIALYITGLLHVAAFGWMKTIQLERINAI